MFDVLGCRDVLEMVDVLEIVDVLATPPDQFLAGCARNGMCSLRLQETGSGECLAVTYCSTALFPHNVFGVAGVLFLRSFHRSGGCRQWGFHFS